MDIEYIPGIRILVYVVTCSNFLGLDIYIYEYCVTCWLRSLHMLIKYCTRLGKLLRYQIFCYIGTLIDLVYQCTYHSSSTYRTVFEVL